MRVNQAPIIDTAVEGDTDEAAVQRMLSYAGAQLGTVYGKNGKPALFQRIAGYVNAARFSPWLIVVDLDHEASCAPNLLRVWVPSQPEQLCFRVAVREIEAWLMADHEQLAKFMAVRKSLFPKDPDAENDPKQKLIQLAQHSTKSAVRADFIPRAKSGRSVGPGYTAQLMKFARRDWRPDVAAERSTSLSGALRSLRQFTERMTR